MTPRPRVAIVQEAILQYRERFYELLRRELERDGIDLMLIHSNPFADAERRDLVDLPWSVTVPLRQIDVRGFRLLWQPCLQHLHGSDLVIVEHASRHLLTYLLVAEQRLGRRLLAFWGHGKNFQTERTNRPSEWVKQHLAPAAHWWFAYNEESAEVVASTGFPPERITVVRNTVDVAEVSRLVDSLDEATADWIRHQLGLTGQHVGLFIGALDNDKRLDLLFAAADVVRARVDDFELVVAGAGPEEPSVRAFGGSRPWVRYVGPRFGAEKAQLLRVADIIIAPAWAGLVVLDAFAAGVPPVISADHAHPPEASYVRDGVNGRVVVDGGSAERYALAVAELLQDVDRRAALVDGCRAERGHHSIEAMAQRFATGVRQALL